MLFGDGDQQGAVVGAGEMEPEMVAEGAFAARWRGALHEFGHRGALIGRGGMDDLDDAHGLATIVAGPRTRLRCPTGRIVALSEPYALR